MTELVLQVQGLRKVFRARGAKESPAAVDSIGFDIAAGTCTAIVGESGSGKTTTARIIAGLETRTQGDVLIEGHEQIRPRFASTADRRASTERVQMVFQDPYSSLDPRQTIGSSLHELFRFRGIRRKQQREERIHALLHSVGLDARHETLYPRAMSGGQRQRVAIARALIPEPRLLILDEAVSALDVSVQAQIIQLLNRLRRETAITYLFISHDLAVVEQVSDQVLVMRQGKVVESGPTATILTSPREEYTQRLLAAVPRRDWDLKSTKYSQRTGSIREQKSDGGGTS